MNIKPVETRPCNGDGEGILLAGITITGLGIGLLFGCWLEGFLIGLLAGLAAVAWWRRRPGPWKKP